MRIRTFLRSRSNSLVALAFVAMIGSAASPAGAASVDAAREVPWRIGSSLAARDAARWKRDTTYGPVRTDRVFPGVEAILYGDGPSRRSDFKWPYAPRETRNRASSARDR
jgi:hypothetical protein